MKWRWIDMAVRVLGAVPGLITVVGEIIDIIEKESPSGGGAAKQEAFHKTLDQTFASVDALNHCEDLNELCERRILIDAAKKTGDVLVALRNQTGKYTHGVTPAKEAGDVPALR